MVPFIALEMDMTNELMDFLIAGLKPTEKCDGLHRIQGRRFLGRTRWMVMYSNFSTSNRGHRYLGGY